MLGIYFPLIGFQDVSRSNAKKNKQTTAPIHAVACHLSSHTHTLISYSHLIPLSHTSALPIRLTGYLKHTAGTVFDNLTK